MVNFTSKTVDFEESKKPKSLENPIRVFITPFLFLKGSLSQLREGHLKRTVRAAQDYGAPALPGYDDAPPPPPPATLPLMPYRYGYAVQDSDCNDFNQQEQSDGDQVTR